MLIGVISDTHCKMPSEKTLKVFQGECDPDRIVEERSFAADDAGAAWPMRPVDLIIHAGDIGNPGRMAQNILDALAEVAPVHAVLGNCDDEGYVTQDGPVSRDLLTLQIDGASIAVMHDPSDLKAIVKGMDRKPALRIYGHEHKWKLPESAVSPMLCPGSIHDPRNEMGIRTVALVRMEEGAVTGARIIRA